MKKIFKYKIPQNGLIKLPFNAEVISANAQGKDMFIWALVNLKTNLTETRVFEIIGTGFEFSYKKYNFIDTVFINECVFHIFEVLE